MRLKLLLLLLVPITVFSQSNLTGTIRDAKSGEGIAGASILLGDLGVVSDQNGFFLFKDVKAGYHTLTVSFVGYQKYQQKINLDNSKNLEVDIMLTEDRIELDEVVVSATRSENRISEIPGRVNLISPERLTLTVAQTTDEYLALIPGVQVSRSFGLFSHKSSVTMRGLSGNEQARTLVLIDGIPVNKADGGSVNWNLVSTGDIEG
jgi:outer membrane receptor protein involved in Fe transport